MPKSKSQIKKFPINKYSDLTEFSKDYLYLLNKKFNEIDYKVLRDTTNLIEKTIKKKRNIFLCGNGGSAAISNHFICDAFKNLRTGTNLMPKVYSLNSNSELISAISNDIGYDKVFVFQLESLFKKNDILIAISSSGNSSNIINAAQFAQKKQGKVIGICGFKGGKLKKISNYSFHANIINYGISEDFAHILMHIIIQFLIQKNLKSKNISDCVF